MTQTQEEAQRFTAQKCALQTFQSNRMNATYADLKKNPEYEPDTYLKNFRFVGGGIVDDLRTIDIFDNKKIASPKEAKGLE